jgi:hypothetical protein
MKRIDGTQDDSVPRLACFAEAIRWIDYPTDTRDATHNARSSTRPPPLDYRTAVTRPRACWLDATPKPALRLSLSLRRIGANRQIICCEIEEVPAPDRRLIEWRSIRSEMPASRKAAVAHLRDDRFGEAKINRRT